MEWWSESRKPELMINERVKIEDRRLTEPQVQKDLKITGAFDL